MDWMEQEQERGITITSAATTAFWTARSEVPHQHHRHARPRRLHDRGRALAARARRRGRGVRRRGRRRAAVRDGLAPGRPVQRAAHLLHQQDGPRRRRLRRRRCSTHPREARARTRCRSSSRSAREDKLRGVIDLVQMKALVFDDDDAGRDVRARSRSPTSSRRRRDETAPQLIEAVAEHRRRADGEVPRGQASSPSDELRARASARARIGAEARSRCSAARPSRTRACSRCSTRSSTTCRRPLDIPPVKGKDPKGERGHPRDHATTRRSRALAFKIMNDPFVGHADLLPRLLGQARGGHARLQRDQGQARAHRPPAADARRTSARRSTRCYAGDICAAVGLKRADHRRHALRREAPDRARADGVPRAGDRHRHRAEDARPTRTSSASRCRSWRSRTRRFRVHTDEETGQTIIAGMGELHLEIIVDRLLREFKVEANVGKPQVAYRETITKTVEAEGKYIRQTGGRGQYGHVWLALEPQRAGQGLRVRERDRRRRRSRRSSSRRSRRASREAMSAACSPATRWST